MIRRDDHLRRDYAPAFDDNLASPRAQMLVRGIDFGAKVTPGKIACRHLAALPLLGGDSKNKNTDERNHYKTHNQFPQQEGKSI